MSVGDPGGPERRDLQSEAARDVRHRLGAEFPGEQSGGTHHGDLQAADVECVRALRADRIAGHAVRLLPERHRNQDLRRQGRDRALGRQVDVRAARRPRQGQRGRPRAPGPALCRRAAPVREGRMESRRQRRAVGDPHRGPVGIPVLPAQGPVQVAQVPGAEPGAWKHRRPGGHGRHQVRSGADQGPVRAAGRLCRVRRQQTLQRDVQRPGRHRQDQAGELPGQGTQPADPVPLGRQPRDRLRRRRRQHAGPHRRDGQAPQALHRVPGRGAGPVHEARRAPQVRRRHAEHPAGGAGRRAQQERGRDHLDRGQQLQQRIDADGRGDAAPLPDEGRLPPAEQGRAAGHHRPLPGAARRQGAARPGPAAPGRGDRRPQPGRPGNHRQPGRHHGRAGAAR